MSDIDRKTVEVHGKLRMFFPCIIIGILKGIKFFFSQVYYLLAALFVVAIVIGTISLGWVIMDIGPELVWYRFIDFLQAQGIM